MRNTFITVLEFKKGSKKSEGLNEFQIKTNILYKEMVTKSHPLLKRESKINLLNLKLRKILKMVLSRHSF